VKNIFTSVTGRKDWRTETTMIIQLTKSYCSAERRRLVKLMCASGILLHYDIDDGTIEIPEMEFERRGIK